MRIFAGVPLGGGRQTTVGLSMTAIFGDLGGHFFGTLKTRPVVLYGITIYPYQPLINIAK